MTQTQLTIWGQGQGNVGAAWFNRACQNVDNVAALRQAPGVTGMIAWMQGTVTPNDGGQGMFYWNATSNAPDDNGATTIIPAGYTIGAWVRQPVNPASIANNSITNALLAQAPALTLKGNLTAVTANEVDNTVAAVTAALIYASTASQGVVQLATPAQAAAGTSTTLAVTPAGLASAISGSSLGITQSGSTAITLPGAAAAVGTIGSQGTIKLNNSLILNWGYVQFEDFNAQTSTGWTFPVAFVTAPLLTFQSNCGAAAGQGVNANRGVLSLNSITTTGATYILRDTAMSGTLCAWMVAALGF